MPLFFSCSHFNFNICVIKISGWFYLKHINNYKVSGFPADQEGRTDSRASLWAPNTVPISEKTESRFRKSEPRQPRPPEVIFGNDRACRARNPVPACHIPSFRIWGWVTRTLFQRSGINKKKTRQFPSICQESMPSFLEWPWSGRNPWSLWTNIIKEKSLA